MREPENRDPVRAARDVAAHSIEGLGRSLAFRQLPVATQAAILGDLGSIQRTFATAAAGPMSEAMVGWRPNLGGGMPASQPQPAGPQPDAVPRVRQATETLPGRAGALGDEVAFPAFVAGLIHGTFDAMVDASIRQMETYADLISSVARSLDDFTRDNVSQAQVIDWLSERYPKDLVRDVPLGGSGEPQLRVRVPTGDDETEERSPAWLADYGLEGESLTEELIEQQLIPAARRNLGEGRMKSLATMVLLGLNRIVIRDGTISAHVFLRAAAKDSTKVVYATSQEPGAPSWGERGSTAYALPSTMISTVGVNAQAASDLKSELFGEVKINFASETLPLERLADAARVTLLESHARRDVGRNGSQSRGSEAPAAPQTPAAAAPQTPAASAPVTAPAAAVGGGTP